MDPVIKFGHSAVATPLRGRRNSGSMRRAVFGLVGVVGVLAFIFSAVSPDDDEIQQELLKAVRADKMLSEIGSRYPESALL